MNNSGFSETQYFRRLWVFIALIALNGVFVFAIIQQVVLGKPFGSKPASDGVLIMIEMIPLLLLFFVFSIRLKTGITDKGIYYRFYPFQFTTTFIAWNEVRYVHMRTYNSFYEYGGWGIRVGSPRVGRAINTSQSCNIGLQLQFMDGRLLLIGTRKPSAIKMIVEKMIGDGKVSGKI